VDGDEVWCFIGLSVSGGGDCMRVGVGGQ